MLERIIGELEILQEQIGDVEAKNCLSVALVYLSEALSLIEEDQENA